MGMGKTLFAGLLAMFLLAGGSIRSQEPPTPVDIEALEEEAFKAAAAMADPSVVQIQTIGGQDMVGELIAGTGPTTGVVVSPDGEIITSSFNFAAKPSSILVTLADGRKFPADLVATDHVRQVTLIKIKQGGLTPLTPVPRKDLQVGQWTIALGRTYDASFPNLSVGILSALQRIWGKAVQTDAKVSPANYGGPLIDLRGRCIGILVPMSPDGADQAAGVEWYDAGIGFAVPLEEILPLLPTLRKGEDVRPGRMGVVFNDKGPISGAAIVTSIRPNSPAEQAGMKTGDVVIQANGKPIERIPQLKSILGPLAAGTTLQLVVKRGEQELPISLTLAAEIASLDPPMLGILPARTPSPQGVTVRKVWPGSPAEKAGLVPGDRIESINTQAVKNASELVKLATELRVGTPATLHVWRAGDKVETISLEPALLATTVPDELPPDRGSTALDEDKPTRTGRIEANLPGADGRTYWAYIPETAFPRQYGLVIWLHAPGRTAEAEQLRLWRSVCEERGLIFAGLLADGEWQGEDGPLLKGLLERLLDSYSIDPQRVVLMGEAEGGELALFAGFKLRDSVRGVIAIDAGMKLAPPEAEPGQRQMIVVMPRAGSPRLRSSRSTLSTLEKRKLPALSLEAPEGEGLDEATVNQLGRWIDSLDRF
ncbi:MAG: PDZ domain-containing protein [Planctomycetota bacterium]|nr:MAG: PDZ domain-containing protein [Planctomycetota bacterium]